MTICNSFGGDPPLSLRIRGFLPEEVPPFSDSAGIQTLDLQNRNLTLYSAELRSLIAVQRYGKVCRTPNEQPIFLQKILNSTDRWQPVVPSSNTAYQVWKRPQSVCSQPVGNRFPSRWELKYQALGTESPTGREQHKLQFNVWRTSTPYLSASHTTSHRPQAWRDLPPLLRQGRTYRMNQQKMVYLLSQSAGEDVFRIILKSSSSILFSIWRLY